MKGRQVSHYRLEEELGAGTYGRVYAASHVHDPELRAAVKVVHGSLATDPEFVASLKRECRVLSRLQHPNIVAFRELVLSDDHPPALVLELLDGEDLAEVSARGSVSPPEALRYVRELLTGLAYAHDEGVVHRDVKPSNAFVDSRGRVRVLDFGLAKAADDSRATQTGQIQGTLDYMAPDLFDGHTASPATDVYAAGLVLWELLAGVPACPSGSIMKKMGWHANMGAPDVRTVAPSVPPRLAEAVAVLTAREGRPADASAALRVLADSQAAAASTASTAHRPGTVTLNTKSLRSAPPPSPESSAPSSSEPPKPAAPKSAAPKPVAPKPVAPKTVAPKPEADEWEPEPRRSGPAAMIVAALVGAGALVAVGSVVLIIGMGALSSSTEVDDEELDPTTEHSTEMAEPAPVAVAPEPVVDPRAEEERAARERAAELGVDAIALDNQSPSVLERMKNSSRFGSHWLYDFDGAGFGSFDVETIGPMVFVRGDNRSSAGKVELVGVVSKVDDKGFDVRGRWAIDYVGDPRCSRTGTLRFNLSGHPNYFRMQASCTERHHYVDLFVDDSWLAANP